MIEFRKQNKSRTQLVCSAGQLGAIRARFTTIDPAARFSPHGNGEICPVSVTGSFETPLLLEIAAGVRALFPEERLSVDPEVMAVVRPELKASEVVQPLNSEVVLRDYQEEAVRALLKFGRGILKVPTRGGKSLILYSVVASIFKARQDFRTVLLMVPNVQLVNQMYSDFMNYGTDGRFDVQRFSSGSRDVVEERHPRQRIVISNRQWMLHHLDGLPKKVDVVFVDECHTCSAPHRINGRLEGGFATRFTKMFETPFKFGMTATESDDVKNQWNAKKLFGPVIYEVSFSRLEEDGFVAKPRVVPVEVRFTSPVEFGRTSFEEVERDQFGHVVITDEERQAEESAYVLESQFLAQSREFNEVVVKLIRSSLKLGNCLVLFDRTVHGRLLFDLLPEGSKFYVDGSVPVKEREKVTEILGRNNHAALVAQSATMGVGLTIRSLAAVLLVNLKSATTATLQGIGRGLMTEEGKDALVIFDVYATGRGDALKYSRKHRKIRDALFRDYYGDVTERTKVINI